MNKSIKFAPLHEKWERVYGTQDFKHKGDFPLVSHLYNSREKAQQYANINLGNYPYRTTGKVVKVLVTLEVLPE